MPIWKIAPPLLAVLLCVPVVVAAPEAADGPFRATVIQAASLDCTFSHGKLNCDFKKNKKNKKNKDDGGDQGERSCPPGYVVLAKPNKCGSFCEPTSGDPCAPKAQQQGPAPAAGGNVCCNANFGGPGKGPIMCSTDDPNSPPETEAQIRQQLQAVVPDQNITCEPEK